jgi:hypothetical protein
LPEELKRPERPGPDADSVEIWTWMGADKRLLHAQRTGGIPSGAWTATAEAPLQAGSRKPQGRARRGRREAGVVGVVDYSGPPTEEESPRIAPAQ